MVDEQVTPRGIYKNMLRELGYENVSDCRNGEQAWQTLIEGYENQQPVDLVLCDWQIPKIPGIDLLKMARTDARLKDTTFIFVTHESLESQVSEALRWEVNNYIVTPFSQEEFEKKLQDAHNRALAS